MDYLSTKEVAKDLGINIRSVQNYCKEGLLPAVINYGDKRQTYKIQKEEFYRWKRLNFSFSAKTEKLDKNKLKLKQLTKSKLKELMPTWFEWLKTGKLGGKIVSPRTIEVYEYYFSYYLRLLPRNYKFPVISASNFRNILGKIDVESFSTRRNIYDSLMSFTKYLIEVGLCEDETREQLRKIRPKRYLPAKQPCLTEKQYLEALNAIDLSRGNSDYDKLLSKVLIQLMANTGMRVSEVAKLKLNDIDLDSRVIFIWLTKMNKNRRVGIVDSLFDLLHEYLKLRLKLFRDNHDNFFLSSKGTPLSRKSIGQKLSRLSKSMSYDLSPHMLRRYFVTSNVNKGKPLVHLQILCGHSDISTTRSYCKTTEDEVLEMMKSW